MSGLVRVDGREYIYCRRTRSRRSSPKSDADILVGRYATARNRPAEIIYSPLMWSDALGEKRNHELLKRVSLS